LDAIGDSWSLLIVRDALEGLTRFSQFQNSLGVAKNILSSRLKNLVKHGVFEIVRNGSKRGEYVLTEKGRALFPLIVALRQWGEGFFFAPGEQHVSLVDRQLRLPVRKLSLRSEDGRELRPEDTEIVRPERKVVGSKSEIGSLSRSRRRPYTSSRTA
jgi:DNA-binding HxlR family transcriptional regulator